MCAFLLLEFPESSPVQISRAQSKPLCSILMDFKCSFKFYLYVIQSFPTLKCMNIYIPVSKQIIF